MRLGPECGSPYLSDTREPLRVSERIAPLMCGMPWSRGGGYRAVSYRALALARGGEKAASELRDSVPGSGGEEGVQEGG